MEQNFNLIYQTSFENDSFLELQKYCTELMSKEPEKIFKSPDFSSISEKSLVSLIKHDNLQINEARVWEYVIKWGIAQNPELPSDSSDFSKDDFEALKNTLQQCIPFIKFHDLTSKEFLNEVLPYKKILPKELYKDLLSGFLSNDNKLTKESESHITKEINPNTVDSPRTSKEINLKSVDSKIITYHHVELISKWIDKLEITDEVKNSYEFKLLFRGSRDGFEPKKFHKFCDNKSRTVTVVKVKDSDEILGGYNPITWKSDGSYGITKDSFIFSFKNNDSIENYVFSRVIDEKHALYYGF